MSTAEYLDTPFSTPNELGLPAISYGSVWLVGAAERYPRHLLPLAVHALSSADRGDPWSRNFDRFPHGIRIQSRSWK